MPWLSPSLGPSPGAAVRGTQRADFPAAGAGAAAQMLSEAGAGIIAARWCDYFPACPRGALTDSKISGLILRPVMSWVPDNSRHLHPQGQGDEAVRGRSWRGRINSALPHFESRRKGPPAWALGAAQPGLADRHGASPRTRGAACRRELGLPWVGKSGIWCGDLPS